MTIQRGARRVSENFTAPGENVQVIVHGLCQQTELTSEAERLLLFGSDALGEWEANLSNREIRGAIRLYSGQYELGEKSIVN